MKIRKNILGIKFRSGKLEEKIRGHILNSSIPLSHLENIEEMEERFTYRAFLGWLASKYPANIAIEDVRYKLGGNISGRYYLYRYSFGSAPRRWAKIVVYKGVWDMILGRKFKLLSDNPDVKEAEKSVLFHEIGHHHYHNKLSKRCRKEVKRNLRLTDGTVTDHGIKERYADAYSLCAQRFEVIEPVLMHLFNREGHPENYRKALKLYSAGKSMEYINQRYA